MKNHLWWIQIVLATVSIACSTWVCGEVHGRERGLAQHCPNEDAGVGSR